MPLEKGSPALPAYSQEFVASPRKAKTSGDPSDEWPSRSRPPLTSHHVFESLSLSLSPRFPLTRILMNLLRRLAAPRLAHPNFTGLAAGLVALTLGLPAGHAGTLYVSIGGGAL